MVRFSLFEAQYKSYLLNVISDNQNKYIKKIEDEYNNDLEGLLALNRTNIQKIMAVAKEEIEYLKTIVFRQDTVASKKLREEYENYMQTCYEAEFQVSINSQSIIL